MNSRKSSLTVFKMDPDHIRTQWTEWTSFIFLIIINALVVFPRNGASHSVIVL